MDRFSTKKPTRFLAAKYRVDFCTTLKISGRFFVQVAKYRVDFFCTSMQNIGSIYCTSCKISGRFFVQVAKYRVDFLTAKYRIDF